MHFEERCVHREIAARTYAYARVASAAGTARSSVGLRRRGRAALGQRIEGPSDLTVIRGHWAPLACPRGTDFARRLPIVVVAPEIFVKL